LKIKRSQPAAAPTEIGVGAAEGCDLLALSGQKAHPFFQPAKGQRAVRLKPVVQIVAHREQIEYLQRFKV